jgi:hypothetical protein
MLLGIFGLREPPEALQDPGPAAAPEPEAWHSFTPASRPLGEPALAWPWPGRPVPPDPALDAAVTELEQGWRSAPLPATQAREPELEASL